MLKSFFDSRNMMGSLLEDCMRPLCEEYDLTTMEMDLLLFFANNPECNTATDVVNLKKLTKSHVSSALKNLNDKGYVEKEHRKGNRKTIYIKVTDSAEEIIAKGREAQAEFGKIIFEGFSKEEFDTLLSHYNRVNQNIRKHFADRKG